MDRALQRQGVTFSEITPDTRKCSIAARMRRADTELGDPAETKYLCGRLIVAVRKVSQASRHAVRPRRILASL